MKKTIDYYMGLPYTVEVTIDADGSLVGKIKELSGCMGGGDTWAELGESLEMSKRLWLEVMLEDQQIIPEPETVHA